MSPWFCFPDSTWFFAGCGRLHCMFLNGKLNPFPMKPLWIYSLHNEVCSRIDPFQPAMEHSRSNHEAEHWTSTSFRLGSHPTFHRRIDDRHNHSPQSVCPCRSNGCA